MSIGTPAPGQTTCRNCGFPLNMEASVCGKCGTLQRGKLGGRGSTFTASPISGDIIRRLVKIAFIAAIFLIFRGPVTGIIDNVRDSFEDSGGPGIFSTDDDDDGGFGLDVPGAQGPEKTKGFSGVREVVNALQKNGFKCDQTKVDSEDEYVSSGSCQGYGAHVQINVYLAQNSLDGAESSFFDDDYAFSYVHKDNWFVITQHAVAKKVKGALGGKLFKGTSGI
ncbi:MAG TPA: hypothetical protein VNC78_02575 [Actinomycetota bacterium]|nr:hypothetical protein [Actinomycetota bacterium]